MTGFTSSYFLMFADLEGLGLLTSVWSIGYASIAFKTPLSIDRRIRRNVNNRIAIYSLYLACQLASFLLESDSRRVNFRTWHDITHHKSTGSRFSDVIFWKEDRWPDQLRRELKVTVESPVAIVTAGIRITFTEPMYASRSSSSGGT